MTKEKFLTLVPMLAIMPMVLSAGAAAKDGFREVRTDHDVSLFDIKRRYGDNTL